MNQKQIVIPYENKSLKEILKEKILYNNICNIHHLNYKKYCTTCKTDICDKCEPSYNSHEYIGYENLIPDINEKNKLNEIIKEYEKNYCSFLNIINNWKRGFDILLNEYKLKMNNIIEFMSYFNKEKINFNIIYKYRTIYSILNHNENKNSRILEIMQKFCKNKEKENIDKDFEWLHGINKFKELISSLNKDDSIKKINKILEVINIEDADIGNSNKNSNNKILNKEPNNKNINNIPLLIKHMKNNSFSGKNNNTSASSDANKNKISFENDLLKSNTHNGSGVINFEYTFCKKDSKISQSKSVDNNSNKNNKFDNLKFCVYEKKKIRNKSIDITNNIKKIDISLNNNKINKDILQNSINDTKIYLFQKRPERNEENVINKAISGKNQNILNKTFLYDYKGFDINNKDSGNELLNNTSSIIHGVKYISNSLKNNSDNNNSNFYGTGRNKYTNLKSHSIDNSYSNRLILNKKNNCIPICTLNIKRNKNSSLFSLNRNANSNKNCRPLVNFYKPKKNYSIENINTNREIDNKYINNTYNNNDCISFRNNNKGNTIYVHKKYITLDISKTLSSIDSMTSSIFSSTSTNKKFKGDSNNIFLNETNNANNIYNKYLTKNTTYNRNKLIKNKLYIGLVLGNDECKIGIQTQYNNNFELSNINNNFLNIPTIISFILNNSNNLNIKIGEDAEKLKYSNPSQTIFNIIKLFGKNTREISEKRELWPFNIYNDEKTNKPIIKISKNDKKKKYIYYNFEDLLTIYLKKLFEIFFNKLVFNNTADKENYFNMNTNKYIDINIDINISVPNYFNYLQREIIKNIFIEKLFPKKEIKKNNYIKSNIYGNFNIQLTGIKIENVSNTASFYYINKNLNNNIQKYYKNILVLYIDGGSTNLSIINLSKRNNNIFLEIKAINGEEFGEEDFLDYFIYFCLSELKENIKDNYLKSKIALAKLRKALNDVKNSFDKADLNQNEININKLSGNFDLKMTINKKTYYKSCMGLFRKIIYLIKNAISNSNIEIKDINDIILLGNVSQNIKLRNMISEIFKDNNKSIYNKLINKNNDNDINNCIIKGAIIQCFNNSMNIPKYKFINITYSSLGIESISGIMDIVIQKGSNIPIKINKYIKIKKYDKNLVDINIYEGENKFVKNNKLICTSSFDITNYNYEKNKEKYIEVLFQFFIDSNYNLNVYIIDKNSFRRLFECLTSTNINFAN